MGQERFELSTFLMSRFYRPLASPFAYRPILDGILVLDDSIPPTTTHWAVLRSHTKRHGASGKTGMSFSSFSSRALFGLPVNHVLFVRNMIKNFQPTLLLCLVEHDGLCRRPFTIYTLNWLIATNTWSATTDCGGRNRTYYLRLMRTATFHLSSPRKKRWESNPLPLVCN